jgi:hypothetical protein
MEPGRRLVTKADDQATATPRERIRRFALIYARVDDDVFCSFGRVFFDYQSFLGGMLGAAGTIAAGRLAWLAVQRQLSAQERRDRQTDVSILEGYRNAFGTIISGATHPLEPFPPHAVRYFETFLPQLARVDERIGFSVGRLLDEIERHQRSTEDLEQATGGQRSPIEADLTGQASHIAARAVATDRATMIAEDPYAQTGVTPERLITEADLAIYLANWGLRQDKMAWAFALYADRAEFRAAQRT